MHQERIEALQNTPIFGGLRPDVLAALVERAATVRVLKDHFFFQQGDRAESMFVLEGGQVDILKSWGGQQHVIGRLKQGDCFGEMALLDLHPRSASVRAVGMCTAIELKAGTFQALYERDVEQFAIVQMNIARELSRRLRRADERLFHSHVGVRQAEREYEALLV